MGAAQYCLFFLVLGIISAAVGETGEQEEKGKIYGIGQPITIDDITVTLTNVYESNGSQFNTPSNNNVFVICEFDIQNNTDHEIAVSSLLSFTAYFNDYAANLSLGAILEANKTQLDGAISAKRKMSGVVGYEAPSDWRRMEIRFTPEFWNGKEMIFKYHK